jgi:hypothetical protein
MDRIRVNEGSSKTVTFTITNEVGTAIPSSELTAATLTLYDLGTYVPGASPVVGIINSRNGQDVLNTNDVTIHATSGLVTWVMQPEDNPIINTRRQVERHRANIGFEWSTGQFHFELEVDVVGQMGVS